MLLFLERGADVMAKHRSGKTSLHFAAEARQENLVVAELLLERGLSINDVDRLNLFSPLHLALKTENEEMVRSI